MNRIKFEVWSPELNQWRVAYCRDGYSAVTNGVRMLRYGFTIRVDGEEYSSDPHRRGH